MAHLKGLVFFFFDSFEAVNTASSSFKVIGFFFMMSNYIARRSWLLIAFLYVSRHGFGAFAVFDLSALNSIVSISLLASQQHFKPYGVFQGASPYRLCWNEQRCTIFLCPLKR
ncbi:uncharacterized protein LOC129292263 [Prosopis cineraria]|uniref:uncharacterized protein LOC129292263 n=1 Tax=Prosopis cineraria TaxID=364024 RepID=UPI00240F67EB|nr:uncharacterized protein LOC129292263 [Prosopis cineraria]